MAKIVVVKGETTSGKSEYVTQWYAQDPDNRRVVRTSADLLRSLSEGHDSIWEVPANSDVVDIVAGLVKSSGYHDVDIEVVEVA